MSRLYGDEHRALQAQFGTVGMADRIEDVAVVTEISAETRAFIEARDMFFLSSVDQKGRPTVSYKGGAPGFVRVLGDKTIAFPNYDGNGMYFSMGNIVGNAEVGLLFMDFEKPHRIRAQGTASVSANDPLIATWKEADLVVRVDVHELWQNCPRYVHRYQKVKESRYVPQDGVETPIAGWKRIEGFGDVLLPGEAERVAKAGGEIGLEEWAEHVTSGDERA